MNAETTSEARFRGVSRGPWERTERRFGLETCGAMRDTGDDAARSRGCSIGRLRPAVRQYHFFRPCGEMDRLVRPGQIERLTHG